MKKIKQLVAGLMLTALALRCSGYSTQQLLDTDFVAKDLTPVILLSPLTKAVTGKTPAFSWTPRQGIVKYTVELASDSSFGNIVLSHSTRETSYELRNADLTGLGELEAASYYVRVWADFGSQRLASAQLYFHIVDSSITYVDCGASGSEQVGNKTFPFKSMTIAIETADARRNSNSSTAVNVHVASGTCSGEFYLKEGISIKGGFASGTWSRDITANESILSSPTISIVKAGAGITTATVLDGFTIEAGTTSASPIVLYSAAPTISNNKINTYTGGFVNSNGANPSIRNNTFNSSPTGSPTSAYVISNIASSPTIANNTINGRKSATSIYAIQNTSGSNPVIENNNINACPSDCSASTSIAILNSGSSPTIRNNFIHAGNGSESRGISSGTDSLGLTITNNIIYGGQGDKSYAIYENTSAGTSVRSIVSNNVLIGGAGGYGGWVSVAMLAGASSNSTIANNIFLITGVNPVGMQEGLASGDPISMENNAFWDMQNYGSPRAFYNSDNSTFYNNAAVFEALTDWLGGADKARGNMVLTSGASGNPFVNVPLFWDTTTVANTGSTTVLLIANNQCGKYTNGDYVEWNGDGIARQITCNGAPSPDQLTITPALSSASLNTVRRELRYWGNKSAGGSQYTLDFHLQQNSLSAQDWNNIRYGGKDTSGNNCGGTGATGPGTQSCGAVSNDKDGVSRSTANAGMANNNAIPNGSVGATAAVPSGFSIGPYESD